MLPNERRRARNFSADLELGENANNQDPQLDHVSDNPPTYPRDPDYYYLDGSGVFLVDGTLFKVPTTLVFGSRQEPSTEQTRGASPIYIEDILPRLQISDESNPIEIPGITTTQFRDYLLVLFGRPYDEEYLKLMTHYRQARCTRHLCVRYLDIMTLAHRFGMTRLEKWAITALHAIFTGIDETLTTLASENWDSDILLRLRTFTKDTTASLPVETFIQYLISFRSKGGIGDAGRGNRITDLLCADLYHSLKDSNTHPGLFGCVFLNILSFGHHSSVWSTRLTRSDRAILYAAQVQLVDVSEGLGVDLGWVSEPDPAISLQFCNACKFKLSEKWKSSFGQCSSALGSGFPLKDVSLLAQLPIYRHVLRGSGYCRFPFACTRWQTLPESTGTPEINMCSIAPILAQVDAHIQQIYERVASYYGTLIEEL